MLDVWWLIIHVACLMLGASCFMFDAYHPASSMKHQTCIKHKFVHQMPNWELRMTSEVRNEAQTKVTRQMTQDNCDVSKVNCEMINDTYSMPSAKWTTIHEQRQVSTVKRDMRNEKCELCNYTWEIRHGNCDMRTANYHMRHVHETCDMSNEKWTTTNVKW